MTDPTTAIAGVAAALGLLERVATLAKSVGDTKNKVALGELEEKLNDARLKMSSITTTLAENAAENYKLLQELHKAKDDLKEAQAALRARTDSRLINGVLWYRGQQQPFCGICRGKLEKDIPLVPCLGGQHCKTCKTVWDTPQPPADFGIATIDYPPMPRHIRDEDDESEFTRFR